MLRNPVRLVLLCLLLTRFSSSQTAAPANGNSLGGGEPEQVRLSEILIRVPQPYGPGGFAKAKLKADEVRKAIGLGGEFADLARANSEGPSAAQGGDLGYFKRGALAKPVEKQVFRMQVGDVSDVARTEYGFVILQVTEREPGAPLGVRNQPVTNGNPSGVRGSVIDSAYHAPIGNAYVLVHWEGGTDVHVRTDKGGKYSVEVSPGIYDVFVSVEGFSPASRKIEVTPNGMMVFDAALEHSDLGMDSD